MGLSPFVLAGGLSGAAGVVLSAAAAHMGGGTVGTAASMLLMHAPAFLAIGLVAATPKLTRIGGWVLLAGLLVFAGDLLARNYGGNRLFPMAAPLGGTLMILGWLVVAGSAFFQRR
jgi:uncharacterized membrane protein YgdD (TMEM256/DUF423 family)